MFLRFRSALPLALARTFSLWFGAICSLPSGFYFYDASKGSCLGKRAELEWMVTIGSRKVWRGLRQILFHHKGKEDFTESALNTEVILASLR